MSTKNLSAPTLDLLTAREAAEMLNIGLNTMYFLLRLNSVPNLRLGRQYMIPRESLRQWVLDKAAEGVR
ncbi:MULTISPECIES: helix-turn-helix domain-containing protein [unclassified Deinococcus]|uniref:helix-turn-helix domain-containing protein n=1 Tax=unclassified Deinococcus TaxID=2623546 RepID=UPI001C2FD6B8|nr:MULTISPECIES: helix-turn-helix domain-containing protein [unclassified Deinococcus]MDK2010999.1 helix-turn-helix domain-containing protein [Deinococcus sp. 43]